MAVKLTDQQVFPPAGTAILVSTRPNTIFQDGKPTDRVDGIRADCRALPDLTPVTVKVPGVATAPISNEEIEARALEGRLTWISFEGFEGVQWLHRQSQELRVSGTATKVRLADAPDSMLDIG